MKISINSNLKNESLKKHLFSIEDFKKLKIAMNLNIRSVCEIASTMRVASKRRNIVQKNLKKELLSSSRVVDNFFSCEEVTFLNTKNNVETEYIGTLIYCNDVEKFIKNIKDEKGVANAHLKFGIYGGGGFLKICLSIQSLEKNESDNKRKTYSEGIAPKKFKDSGVKNCLY